MNILCITGAPAPVLQDVAALLQQCGVAAPKGLERQPVGNLGDWHDLVIARASSRDLDDPGRLWDQLAADLFLANMDAPLWGWADERSVALLQYWAEFEPGVCFVLLCETPQQLLTRLIRQQQADTGIEDSLRAWKASHETMLRFHLRNPQRSMLLWAADAEQHPAALLNHLQARWALPLDGTAVPNEPAPAPDALAQYLAQALAAQYPELEPLRLELEACVTPLEAASPPTLAAIALPDMVAAYRTLADRSREQQALARLEEQARRQDLQAQQLTQALDLRSLELEQALKRHEEHASLSQALLQHKESLEQELTEVLSAVEQLTHQVKHLDADKSALLHGNAKLAESLSANTLALDAAREQVQTQAQRAEDLARQLLHANAERDEIAQARSHAEQRLSEAHDKAGLLQLQLRQAQEELEANFHNLAQADKRMAELQQRLAAMEQEQAQACAQRDAERAALTHVQGERDALAAHAQQLQAALDARAHALEQAQAQQAADALGRERAQAELCEVREGAELLQLQLRQAHEELEANFHNHAQADKRMVELQQRLAAAEQDHAQACAQRDAQQTALTHVQGERDALAARMAAQLAESEALVAQAQQLQAALDARAHALEQAQAQQAAEALGREHAQAELREAREEAELLQLQLRQAQEELEANFHNHAQADKRMAELQQRLAAMEQNHAQACAQRDAERTALTHVQGERDALAARIAAQVGENEALRAQAQQLQAALDARAHALEQAQARQAAEVLAREHAQAELQDAREEAELLQLQLRQVQEELESYFRKHVDGHEQLKAAQARLQRMQQRFPGYCDFEALEALPGKDGQAQEARWRVHGLDAGGRHIRQLDFFTVQRQGVAGIGMERNANEVSPLMRWPADMGEGGRLVLLPQGTAEELKRQIAALMELSTSDWELLQTLPKLLLAQPGQPYAAWSAALQQLQKQMAKWPPALRFDTLQLVREQTNPDYEHLWLRLGNVSLGAQRWPHLEFRLACANTQDGRFGQQPKLEFPMAARAVLKGWFEESSDDFGAKLELRFAMPDSMDRRVWARLPAGDQQLITALLAVLPRMLGLLAGPGMRPRRAVEQWQTVAMHMLRVLRQLAVPARGVAARPAAVAQAVPAQPGSVAPIQTAPAATPVAAQAAPSGAAAAEVPAPAAKVAKAATARKKPAARAKAVAKEVQA